MESSKKRVRFEKVASGRVQRVLNTIELLKNCSNRSNYEYSKEDVEKMFSSMSRALKEAKNVYESELGKQNKSGFSFN